MNDENFLDHQEDASDFCVGDDGFSFREVEIREQDRFLPVANIARIMKKVLPNNAKIAKDAKEGIQECVSEFISFITSEASDKCQQEKRKTINGDDLLWAMSTLGFDKYVEPLKLYLAKYRESVKGEKPEKKSSIRQKIEGSFSSLHVPSKSSMQMNPQQHMGMMSGPIAIQGMNSVLCIPNSGISSSLNMSQQSLQAGSTSHNMSIDSMLSSSIVDHNSLSSLAEFESYIAYDNGTSSFTMDDSVMYGMAPSKLDLLCNDENSNDGSALSLTTSDLNDNIMSNHHYPVSQQQYMYHPHTNSTNSSFTL